jgi:hypothetical protein
MWNLSYLCRCHMSPGCTQCIAQVFCSNKSRCHTIICMFVLICSWRYNKEGYLCQALTCSVNIYALGQLHNNASVDTLLCPIQMWYKHTGSVQCIMPLICLHYDMMYEHARVHTYTNTSMHYMFVGYLCIHACNIGCLGLSNDMDMCEYVYVQARLDIYTHATCQ